MKKHQHLEQTLAFERVWPLSFSLQELPPRVCTPTHHQAYCLYRLGRLEEALAAAATIDASNAEAAQQLQAQLLYRTDQGADALATYAALRTAGGVDAGELAANTVATALLAGKPEEGLAIAADKSRGAPRFETVFNAACCSLALGQAAQAEEQILLAQRLGTSCVSIQGGEHHCVCTCTLPPAGQELLFEEGCEEAEVEAELAPLVTQLAYTYSQYVVLSADCLFDLASRLPTPHSTQVGAGHEGARHVCRAGRQQDGDRRCGGGAHPQQHGGRSLAPAEQQKAAGGSPEEAGRAHGQDRPPQAATRAAAAAGHAAKAAAAVQLRRAARVGRAQRCGKAASAAAAAGAWGRHARPHAAAGRAGGTGQQGGYRSMRATLPVDQTDNQVADADAVLAKLAASSPDHAVAASLLRAQTAAAAGNLRGAVSVLKALNAGPLAHRPGVVASVVGLLVHVGEGGEAEQVLQAALQHWQNQSGSDQRCVGLGC